MTLETRVNALATRAGVEDKALRTLLNGNAADLLALTTTNKTHLVAALNELNAAISAASGIDDAVTTTTASWSGVKVTEAIAAAIAALVGAAPAALDTLVELSAAINDDATAFDTLQTLVTNNATALTDYQALIGDTDANYVTTFEAALV